MTTLPVCILDKDPTVGAWILNHLHEIGVEGRWIMTVSDLLAGSEDDAPRVCLIALRPPVNQALSLVTNLTQEPRFARTVFILMGPMQYKHAAFEAGTDDYITTPPDVIELRKRVRLYLDRATLEDRVVAETSITQEMEALRRASTEPEILEDAGVSPMSLLEHAAALTEETNRLELVLTYAGDAISLVGVDGTLLYVNPAWEQLMGYSAAHAADQPFHWPPPTETPEIHREIAAALAVGEGWQGELRYTLPNGRKLDVAMTITPAFDASRELVAYVVTQHDVAERRAAEDLRAQFLADAAVEMRTPVTNIKMRQQLLRQSPPEQRDMHLQAFEREIERLARLVDAMLELARLDLGQIEMEQKEIDLNRLAADAVAHYESAAVDQGVTLALTKTDAVPPVLGDPDQITHAIGILIDNAIQYTPEAGHIDIRLGHETWTGGEFVTIQVQDTGLGIAPDALPHIFERFYRSVRARDSGARGVGLGLAIAREIINRHNGEITVESQPNQGSAFTIWLPFKAAG